jgi:hypothetical protein
MKRITHPFNSRQRPQFGAWITFNEYLKGSQFTLYANPTPAPELRTTQMTTWNGLKTAMSEHKFLTQNDQKANLPEHLKHYQHNHTDSHRIKSLHFNEKIHVDMFLDLPDNRPVILAITDENMAYSVSTSERRSRKPHLDFDLSQV